MTDFSEYGQVEARREPARMDEERTALIRDRIVRGFYRGEWVRGQIAKRMLASGDLEGRTDR